MLVATALLAIAGCQVGSVRDSWSQIPQSIAGEELVYDELHGAAAHDWALEVLATTKRPVAALRSATGFTSPDENEYQSFVLSIAGVDGQALIGPMIEAVVGIPPIAQWEESIEGKTVLRFIITEGIAPVDASYAYAFDDVVILLGSRRPAEAREALRAMP